jgi:hypothetical protein
MLERRAACACGRLSVVCLGDPVRISVCHCLECQRRTGSAFGVQARFPQERVTVHGSATEYVRVADDGGRVTLRFCPSCGSTVYYDLESVPGFIGVPIGGFADPKFPAPLVSIYETSRHPWVVIPDVEHQS